MVETFLIGLQDHCVVINAKGLVIKNRDDVSRAINFGIGKQKDGVLHLSPIEAIYLYEIKRFEVDDVDSLFCSISSSLDKYLVYRDISTRGYKASFKDPEAETSKPAMEYKGENVLYSGEMIRGAASKGIVFCPGGKDLYSRHWFGQFGVYKREGVGNSLVLDQFEAEYLKEKGILDYSGKVKQVKYFGEYYMIYREWRERGFILKSGFKFGGDFRIYFPGTSPENFEHSKHILQVFPKKYSITAGEWARAVRISHSIRKTFILAIPSSMSASKFKPDMIASRESSSYAVKVFYESDIIKGEILHSALSFCAKNGVRLLIAIVDRDTSVSYYTVERVVLEGSENMYFEVSWFRA